MSCAEKTCFAGCDPKCGRSTELVSVRSDRCLPEGRKQTCCERTETTLGQEFKQEPSQAL